MQHPEEVVLVTALYTGSSTSFDCSELIGPNVHCHCRCRLLRPAIGVAGQVSSSLSSSSDDSRFSPACGHGKVVSFVISWSSFFSLTTSSSFRLSSGSGILSRKDVGSSMSECLSVYFDVMISSVNWVRNATFLGVGNMGLDCANEVVRHLLRSPGPFFRMDTALKGSLYGASEGDDSMLEVDVVDTVDDVSSSKASEASRESFRDDGSVSVESVVLSVVTGTNAGLLVLSPNAFPRSCAFLKVFVVVGDVAESVSSLRLVDLLPYIGATPDVLRLNFGRFAGVALGVSNGVRVWPYAIGEEGSRVTDIVPVPLQVGDDVFNGGVDSGIKASMISQKPGSRGLHARSRRTIGCTY